MGVKQTTDVLEKGTWIFAAAVGILCMISPLFIPKAGGSGNNPLRENLTPQKSAPAATPQANPAINAPLPGTTDTTKK